MSGATFISKSKNENDDIPYFSTNSVDPYHKNREKLKKYISTLPDERKKNLISEDDILYGGYLEVTEEQLEELKRLEEATGIFKIRKPKEGSKSSSVNPDKKIVSKKTLTDTHPESKQETKPEENQKPKIIPIEDKGKEAETEKPLYKSVWFWLISVIVFCIVFQINPIEVPPLSWLLMQDEGHFYNVVGEWLKSNMMGMNFRLFIVVLVVIWGLNSHRNPNLKNPKIKKINSTLTFFLGFWITPFVLYYGFFIILGILAIILVVIFGGFGGNGPNNSPSDGYGLGPYMFPEDKYFDDDFDENDDDF